MIFIKSEMKGRQTRNSVRVYFGNVNSDYSPSKIIAHDQTVHKIELSGL
jgi:hypothetical protein